MKEYAFVLFGLALFITACGVVLGLLTLPPFASIPLLVVGATVGATLYSYLGRSLITLGPALTRQLGPVTAAAASFLAMGGLVGLMGPIAFGLVVVLGMGALPLLKLNSLSAENGLTVAQSTVVSRTDGDGDAVEGASASVVVPRFDEQRWRWALADWSVEQLRWAWRCSFVWLQRSAGSGSFTSMSWNGVAPSGIARG